MRRTSVRLFGWTIAALCTGVLSGPARVEGAPPAIVTSVELVSPHRLDEAQVQAAIGSLVGRPRERGAIRESLDRLWSLGLFSEVRVEELSEPGGIRLSYRLVRRPHVRQVSWRGDLRVDVADLAIAAGLAERGPAEPERLARARRDILATYRREGFFAAEVGVETAEDPATNARDVTFVVEAGPPARIGRVRIHGAVAVPEAVVAKVFKLDSGDRYRDRTLRSAVRAVVERVRGMGYYEARVLAETSAWDPETERVDVDLEIREGPEHRVEFVGRTAIEESALVERLTFIDGGVVDPLEVRANARQVELAYRERGYHFVEVGGEVVDEDALRLIRFLMTEGPRVTVEAVDFTGNRAVSTERLRAQIETAPPALLRPGVFRQEVLDRDLRVLESFLRGEGFLDATVGPAAARFSDDRTKVRISIPIAEGPLLTVGALSVEGQTIFAAAEILAALPIKPGEPWSQARADAGRRAVERLYSRRGYHGARIELEAARRDGTVDVSLRIREGSQTRIGRILIRGLVLTKERVVLRELGFRPGDPLDPVALTEAQRRLVALRLFDWAEVEPLRPPPAPFADVEITLRERKPWRLDFGVGFGTDEGVRGFLEIGHDNLFGTGRSASLRHKVSAGGSRTDFGDRTDAIYRDPRIFGTAWTAQIGLFQERTEEIGYDLDRYGGTLGIQRDLLPKTIPGLRGAIRYRLEDVRRSHVDPGLVAADVVAGRELIASVTPALTLDRRDDPLDPSRGSFHLVSVEFGGAPVGGEVEFVKTRLETSWFLDWLSPTVLALSGRLGLATPYGSTDALAIEDRFFTGGSTSVRGFRENRLGPRDAAGNPLGGNALVVASVEWRFPLWRFVGGALFYDIGAVTPEVDDLDPDALKSGVGVGLRLKTPVGPVRFDVGYALDPIPGERRLQFYLTVGNPF